MGRLKNEGQLRVAKCILNDCPVDNSVKFRGLDLDQFTSIELIKIVGLMTKHAGDTLWGPTKVEPEFKVDDLVCYKGCVNRITKISGAFANIYLLGNTTTEIVQLKDLTHVPK